MSERGKEICQAGRALSKKQKLERNDAENKRIEEQYQKALALAKERVDAGSTLDYITLEPYCAQVAKRLRADGFEEINTDDGMLFSWEHKNSK